jgi:predicted O-methyltransferase YrrM
MHVSRTHFYSPIPNVGTLPAETWRRKSSLPGIDMRDAEQLRLLRESFPAYRAEYDLIPRTASGREEEYYFENGFFGGTDALVLYCMIRHFRPQRIIEVGAGFSSRLAAQAASRNGGTRLTCIEPYPGEVLRRGFPGLESLIESPVQNVDGGPFDELTENDILFIDSSHVSKIGSDVNYLFLEVIPRLRPGVLVHVHDIFLPYEYPRGWVVDELRFWTEQYLLQAFLAFNSQFEVLFANSYVEATYPGALREVFPNSPWWGGGSFWMRRVAG